jgi:hypothetical protein
VVSVRLRWGFVAIASSWGVLLGSAACTSTPDYLPPCIDPHDPHCIAPEAGADASDAKPVEARPEVDGCPPDFCACTCVDGGKGYRPQCGLVSGACMATDPCISGLDPEGGWLVCGM